MPIAVSLAVSLLLVATTVLLHYELLQFAAGLPARLTAPGRSTVLMVIAVVLGAHVIASARWCS